MTTRKYMQSTLNTKSAIKELSVTVVIIFICSWPKNFLIWVPWHMQRTWMRVEVILSLWVQFRNIQKQQDSLPQFLLLRISTKSWTKWVMNVTCPNIPCSARVTKGQKGNFFHSLRAKWGTSPSPNIRCIENSRESKRLLKASRMQRISPDEPPEDHLDTPLKYRNFPPLSGLRGKLVLLYHTTMAGSKVLVGQRRNSELPDL